CGVSGPRRLAQGLSGPGLADRGVFRLGPVTQHRDHLGRGRLLALPAERLVYLDQDLLLPLGELRVGQQRGPDTRVPRAVLQDAGLHVECLGGDPQPLGDLLQDLRARLAQAALDLAQVRVGDPGLLGQLPQRDLRLLPLLLDVVPDAVHVRHDSHASSPACSCKSAASTRNTFCLPVSHRNSGTARSKESTSYVTGTDARCVRAKASVSARSASRSSLVAARRVFTSATTMPR